MAEAHFKACQDTGVHGGGPKGLKVVKPAGSALPTRSSKRGHGELVSSPEKTVKQPKVTTAKSRKAVFIPKIKMTIPMAST